jgi:taurine transport system permease protein
MDAYNYLKVDVVFIVIIVMGITGIIIDELLKLLGRKLVYWTD